MQLFHESLDLGFTAVNHYSSICICERCAIFVNVYASRPDLGWATKDCADTSGICDQVRSTEVAYTHRRRASKVKRALKARRRQRSTWADQNGKQ